MWTEIAEVEYAMGRGVLVKDMTRNQGEKELTRR
jgi:hypothetical protein